MTYLWTPSKDANGNATLNASLLKDGEKYLALRKSLIGGDLLHLIRIKDANSILIETLPNNSRSAAEAVLASKGY